MTGEATSTRRVGDPRAAPGDIRPASSLSSCTLVPARDSTRDPFRPTFDSDTGRDREGERAGGSFDGVVGSDTGSNTSAEASPKRGPSWKNRPLRTLALLMDAESSRPLVGRGGVDRGETSSRGCGASHSSVSSSVTTVEYGTTSALMRYLLWAGGEGESVVSREESGGSVLGGGESDMR